MDYFGNLFFIALLVMFAIGSYLTSKAQKAEAQKMNKPQTDAEELPAEEMEPMTEVEPVPQPVPPVAVPRKSKRKAAAKAVAPTPPHTPPHHSSQLKEKQKVETNLQPEKEPEGINLALDLDDMKKAVIYSEILNRKYS